MNKTLRHRAKVVYSSRKVLVLSLQTSLCLMIRIILLLSILLPGLLPAQDLTGDWHGTLEISGMQLRLVLHITETDGQYTTTMDSPDQGANGIAMDETIVEGNNIQISMAAAQISMQGTYVPGADSLHYRLQAGSDAIATRDESPGAEGARL
jgi:hypothetical protein